MIDSTIWVEREARELFITALLMAEPKEFAEPLTQLAVRSIEPTGFVAPAGWYGYVNAAGPGIIRRAIMEAEDGLRALEVLGEPDPGSRSSDFEGRRMIRVDGGYVILNYMKYRDKDHTAAQRARRYRDRKRASQRDVTESHPHITQAEAEANKRKSSRPTKSVGPDSERPLKPKDVDKDSLEAKAIFDSVAASLRADYLPDQKHAD